MTSSEVEQVRAARAWTAFLAVIAVGHHLGTLTAPLGEVGAVQWADLVDLLLPYSVVATAGAALLAVPRRHQVVGAHVLVAAVAALLSLAAAGVVAAL